MYEPILKPKDRPRIKQPAYEVLAGGREVCCDTWAGRAEYKSRTAQMVERQGGLCGLCGLMMRPWETSFDHENGRGHGGAKRDDRIEVEGVWQNAAVHVKCNGEKGSKRVPYIITQFTPAP